MPYFRTIVCEKKRISIIRIVPNLRNQDGFYVLRMNDCFVTIESSINENVKDIINEMLMNKNIFCNIIVIDYYSE